MMMMMMMMMMMIFNIIVATGEANNCQGELRVEKEEERKISEFAQSTSRSPKHYLREEAKVMIKLKDNKKFQERRNTFLSP